MTPTADNKEVELETGEAAPEKVAKEKVAKEPKQEKEGKGEAKKIAPPSAAQRSAIAARTIQFIAKVTGQKPMHASMSQMPHIPSGSFVIDNVVGGSKARDGKGAVCPGYPRRRIIEIYGAESSGKTTLALKAVAEVQKRGGLVMFLDFEHALHHGYAQSIGVSFAEDKLLLYAPNTLEEGSKMIYLGIKTGVDLIVVDSVSAMVPAAELEKKLDAVAKLGALAKAMSEFCPKLVQWLALPCKDKDTGYVYPGTCMMYINQIRALISSGGGYGEEASENTSGGKALKFYSYLRLRLKRTRFDFIEKKDPLSGKPKRYPYGSLVQVKIVKNKVDATQGHTSEIFIRHGFGVDEYHSVIEGSVARHLVKKNGGAYTYGSHSAKSKEKFRTMLVDDPKLYEELRAKLVNSLLDEKAAVVVGPDEDSDESMIAELEGEFNGDELPETDNDDMPVDNNMGGDLGVDVEV